MLYVVLSGVTIEAEASRKIYGLPHTHWEAYRYIATQTHSLCILTCFQAS